MLQQMMNVNWLAILVCGIALMVVGFIWYTVFAKQWSDYTGWTREKISKIPQNQMTTSYVITFVTALVMVFVLANFLKLLPSSDLGSALLGAIMVWIGFTAAPGISNFAFERRPWGLLAIISGNTLVSLLVSAVILTLWK
jgi:Trk-type K+ transport system membrane component